MHVQSHHLQQNTDKPIMSVNARIDDMLQKRSHKISQLLYFQLYVQGQSARIEI